MIKVMAVNGNTFEFDADHWMPCAEGIVLYKNNDTVAQFSGYQFVQKVSEPETPVTEETPSGS